MSRINDTDAFPLVNGTAVTSISTFVVLVDGSLQRQITRAQMETVFQPYSAVLAQIAALADPDLGTGTTVAGSPVVYWDNAGGQYGFLEFGDAFVLASGFVQLNDTIPTKAGDNAFTGVNSFTPPISEDVPPITIGGIHPGIPAILVDISDVATVLRGRFVSDPTQYCTIDMEGIQNGTPRINLQMTHPTLGDSGLDLSADGHFFFGPGDVWINNTRVRGVATPVAGTDAVNLTYVATTFQPLDADLTAIAALITTAYGRSLLTLADATALAALVDASFLTPAEGNAAYQPLNTNLNRLAAMTDPAVGTGTAIGDCSVIAWDNNTNQLAYFDLSSQFVVSSTGVISFVGTVSPAGVDTQVQFNDGGVAGGDAGLTYNKTTDSLTVKGNHFIGSGTMSVGSSGVGVLVVGNSTVPTTFPADEAQAWCADLSALNAAWHFAGEGLVAGVMVGGVTIRQKGGTAGTDESRLSHDGTHFTITNENNGSEDKIKLRFKINGNCGILIERNDGASAMHYLCQAGIITNATPFAVANGDPTAVGADISWYRVASNVWGAGAGGSSGTGKVLCSYLVEANTAGSGSPNILTAAESRTIQTNEGATAENYHTLPSAVAGLSFPFIVQDTDGMRITAAAGDTIQPGAGASVSSPGGFIRCATAGASIVLVAINATQWMSLGPPSGTWTVDV